MTPPDVALIRTDELPDEVVMNQEAGRGMLLFVKVRLDSGEEISCAVDTGAPTSHLSGNVENKLGKRLGERKFTTLDETVVSERIYASPKLFLGNTRLVTADRIGVTDGSMGLLGMDCLRHYCIELDFETRTLRFLDPEKVNTKNLGTAYPLTYSPHTSIRHGGLFGLQPSKLIVDTGCFADAYLPAKEFKLQVKDRNATPIPLLKDGAIQGAAPGFALFPRGDWDGASYTNLVVGMGTGPNLIGLRFLARHKVTFNFPKDVMYLKQTSVGPLSE